MAIINTYPKATPKGADLLIGTQVKDDNITENSTKSFSVSAIGSFLITSNDIVTGSGTTDQVLKFTDGPNGVIGDSLIKSYTFAPGTGGEEPRVECSGVVISSTGRFQTVQTDSIVASDTGSVTMNGNVAIGNSYLDELNITSTTNIWNVPVKSGPTIFGALAPGADYVLASTASSTLEWKSIGVQTAQVTVTDAQIQTLGTVPVEILPGVTNKIYQIIGLTTQTIGNAGLTDSYDWSASGDGVFYGQGFTPPQHRVEIPNSRLPQGGASLAPSGYVASPISGDWKIQASMKLSTTTGVDPTIVNSPSAEMVVNVTYRLIELA